MSQTSDLELKRAALLIVKMILRTREGKIVWKNNNAERGAAAYLGSSGQGDFVERFTADLEDGIQAVLIRDSRKLVFALTAPPTNESSAQSSSLTGVTSLAAGEEAHGILKVSLHHDIGRAFDPTPESVVYRDLLELVQLAANPKSVSDDRRYKQAMSYLDKLTA